MQFYQSDWPVYIFLGVLIIMIPSTLRWAHNFKRARQRTCVLCGAQKKREHLIACLDSNYFLCQTQEKCVNEFCHQVDRPVVMKTYRKYMGFRSKAFRLRQLRKTVPIECFIQDSAVAQVLANQKKPLWQEVGLQIKSAR